MKTIRGLISASLSLLVMLAGAPGAQADIVTDANAAAETSLTSG